MFFERIETGVSLHLCNTVVARDAISIAIALRENQQRVAHTLFYTRGSNLDSSFIDLVQRYDSIRRNSCSGSKYYWALLVTRFSNSPRTMKLWLKFFLTRIQVSPPPQVALTPHSLRKGAVSECVAIGAQEYHIMIWGDCSSGQTFRQSNLDAWELQCDDPYLFFGYLL